MTHSASDTTPTGQDHADHLAHHFATPAQQFDASKMGMWVFLVTEILFFSGLFCAYAVYRHNHPAMFAIGSQFLDKTLGAVNTVVLILSSFTMASAVYFAQRSNRKGLITCLSLTLLGGAVFMSVKGYEYADKIQHGKVWGAGYHYNPTAHHGEGAADAPAKIEHAESNSTIAAGVSSALADNAAKSEQSASKIDYNRKDLQIFMGIYFCLTGLHGIHVLAGMGVIVWLLIGAIKGRFDGSYYTPVDLGGLYWHLVDLIWIYLFPLLYLID